ncbi:MAG: cache domain-containing protein [Pseudomonadota bacterium]
MAASTSFSNLRIRYKLILSYGLCFILIFLAGSSYIYVQVRGAMVRNLEAELENKTAMMVNLITTSVDLSIKNHLRAVAEKNLELVRYCYNQFRDKKLSQDQARQLASELLLSQTVGRTGYLYVIDSRGVALVHPQKAVQGNDYSSFAFIRDMIRMKTGFLVYDWKNPNEPKPLPKAQYFAYFPEWDWIIAATSYRSEFLHLVNVGDLEKSINSIRVGDSGYSAIINSKGDIIVHPKLSGNLFEQPNREMVGVTREFIEKKSGTFTYLWQNPGDPIMRKKIAIANYISEYDWVVMSTVYADDVFKPLVRITRLFSVISLVSVLMAVVVSFWLGKVITRPIERLTWQLSQVPEGSLPRAVDVSGKDEIGLLSETFNRFLDRFGQEMNIRKQAQDSLRQSDEKFRAIFNSTYNYTGLLTAEGRVVEVNRAALDLIGADLTDVAGHLFWETPWWNLSDSSRTQLREKIIQCLETGFVRSEARHRDMQGSLRHIDFSLKRLVDASNSPWGIVAEGRDITERKLAEAAMQESDKRHRAILEGAPNPIVLYDPRGRVLFVNQAFTRVFGWTLDELQGRRVDFVPPESLPETIKAVNAVKDGQSRYSFETRRLTKNGDTLDVSISAAAFRTRADAFEGMVVNLTDITHIKAIDRELRSARDYIRNIINSMPSILVSVNSGGRVTQWNLEAEHITGIPWRRAEGNLLMEVFPQLEPELATIQRSMDRKSIEKSTKVKLPDMETGEVYDITIYPLVFEEETGAVIIITDVSRQVAMEAMMIQSEKMLSVGGLAAGMAHEINNPLAGIMQSAQVMLKRLTEPMPANLAAAGDLCIGFDVIREYMEKRQIVSLAESIHTAGARAARIVENMLSFSRKGEQSFSGQDLGELLDATLEIAENDYALKKQYDFRSIAIVRDYASGLPRVVCERSQIQQVFFNILQNGAQAMSGSGRPPGEKPRFILRVRPDGEFVRVEIQDNGPGMDILIQKRIFEPFFTTKGVGQGTGLGLSVSYFIITENHRGTIAVESLPGQGSRFIIRLPFNPAS